MLVSSFSVIPDRYPTCSCPVLSSGSKESCPGSESVSLPPPILSGFPEKQHTVLSSVPAALLFLSSAPAWTASFYPQTFPSILWKCSCRDQAPPGVPV